MKDKHTPNSIDFNYFLSVAITKLNMTPKDFWQMPFFTFIEVLNNTLGQKEEMSRAEVLDAVKARREKLGWL